MSTAQAFIAALFGSSGSGKSAAVKQWLAHHRPTRLLIWDTMNEYGEHAKEARELATVMQAAGAGDFRSRYTGMLAGLAGQPEAKQREILIERFDTFCAVAYALGDTVLVVEELQTVTRPAWAPAAWSDCTLRGRHKGLVVFGLAQRPAAVDKNFFSNATMVRTGRLNYADDVACMANVLAVPRERIAALAPLHYIQRDMLSGETVPGALEFKPARAANAAPVRRPANKSAKKKKKTARR